MFWRSFGSLIEDVMPYLSAGLNIDVDLHVVNLFFFFFWVSGDLAQLQLPQKNVEVIEGKMVVLQATYTGTEIQKNTVVWNYMSSNTEMVSFFAINTEL